jgi:hypothetical protein
MNGIISNGGIIRQTGNAMVSPHFISPPQAFVDFCFKIFDDGLDVADCANMGMTHFNPAVLMPFHLQAGASGMLMNIDLGGNKLPTADVDAILFWAASWDTPLYLNLSGGTNGVPAPGVPGAPLVVEFELLPGDDPLVCTAWFEHPMSGSIPAFQVSSDGGTFFYFEPGSAPPQLLIDAVGGYSAAALVTMMIYAFNAGMPPASGGLAEAVPGAPHKLRITYPRIATEEATFMEGDPGGNIGCSLTVLQTPRTFQPNPTVVSLAGYGSLVTVNEYVNRSDDASGIEPVTYGSAA